MATRNEHRTKAEELLALGRTYPHNSAARLATFTEAQVEALLALAVTEDAYGTASAPEIDAQLAASIEGKIEAQKAPRRTRKAAPAKTSTEEAAK
ncbi:hypothetical protein SEA_KAYLISSA_52 [Arthrobacter phage Kaylissa]|uniref:Uncharacterized protein n=1 Tax=Arthrobacter phage Kaylissa TaxID=2835951 RepID=A0AA92N445_9CAUD|nr:hypothetical protein PQE14_gp52 [Arthrobacter phage Kaylissa]QIN94450.1 hypothetical protein SEA_LEGO_50 [Arthrobacter phage Lego]QXO14586.1 hypothetical protein SEA_KAYLISSA_52 [Arthrobacter phage Kaylissa]